MKADSRQIIFLTLFALAVTAAATTFAYYPGLSGPFIFDDHVNFVDKPEIAIQSLGYQDLADAAMSNESGIFKRPLAALSFAINYYFSGGFDNTFIFKTTNLVIHLINIGLVFWLSTLLFKILSERPEFQRINVHPRLPILIAAIWALHPIQLTTVLYVVQRMESLSTLFVLSGLIVFVYGRRLTQYRSSRGITLMWGGILGGSLLGMACKENAALLPFFAICIDLTFFSVTEKPFDRQRQIWLYSTTITLLVLLALYWLIKRPELVLGSYSLREFTPVERILTETRVLWFYLSLLLMPGSDRLTLFHDDIPISTGLFSPWTTIFALGGLLIWILIAAVSRRKYPWLSFSILWFLVGHSMESGFIGLELVHEHRNYLPSLGPITGVVYGTMLALDHARHKAVPAVLALLIVAGLTFSTYVRSMTWSDEKSLAESMVRHHPYSARSHATLGDVYLQKGNDPILALKYYKKASELAPYETSYLIRIVFISSLAEIQYARRSAPSHQAIPNGLQLVDGFLSIRKHGEEMHLQLDRSIYSRITEQLKSQPVQARVEETLKILTDCILEHPQQCGSLYKDAIDWYQLALRNPRTNNSIRKGLFINLARLYVGQGDIGQGLQTAQEARKLDSSQPALAIMEANMHFLANRPEQAEQIIHDLMKSGIKINNADKEEADKLLVMIEMQKQSSAAK